MGINGKWTYELYSEEYWTSGVEFDTKEEAISIGMEDAINEEYHDHFWVGQIFSFVPTVCPWKVIEDICEDSYECGEASEDYLSDVTKEQELRLGQLLNEALNKWLDETNNQPRFWRIDNVERVLIEPTEL